MANFPTRCQHLKVNGTQCGSPALRRNRFCYFHKRFQDENIKLSVDRARRGVATFVLPVLEDANSIQIALMQVMRLLISQQMDHKTAALLLYALQTASTNLRLTKFDPWKHDVILDPRAVSETPLDAHLWRDDDFAEEADEEETDEEAEPANAATAAREEAHKKEERKKEERKKKEEKAELDRRNLELQADRIKYGDPKPDPPARQTAAIVASGRAVISPSTPDKKPSSGTNLNQFREEVREHVKKTFFPGVPDSLLRDK